MLRIQLLCCLWIVNIIFCCSSGDSCICLPPVTYVSIPHSSLFHRPEVSHTQLQTRKMGVGGALNIQQWMQLFIESCSISSLFAGNQIWNNHTYSSDHLMKGFCYFQPLGQHEFSACVIVGIYTIYELCIEKRNSYKTISNEITKMNLMPLYR